MSMIMFVIGCVAVCVGVAMVGFGIPVNEFSFGNTLIGSGTTLATGGIVVIALSAAVSQLHRIAEALAAGHVPAVPAAPAMPARPAPAEAFEPPAERAMPARVPFPPKPAAAGRPSEPPMAPPVPADLDEVHPGQSFAPALRNPEAPPVTVEDEVSLSPQYSPPPAEEPMPPPPPPGPPRQERASYFDKMWPAKPRTAAPPLEAEPKREPHREREPAGRATVVESGAEPPRAAVLKSGVVDGMAYTLYVDGSIEAELPQGTLRFASIDELRSHLEKNG
ncbi:MAG TPA: hypothetical protein VFA57_16490 [Pseudolabrys sp.]|nr:hypothetical protein [Pseudolabrys sp.]